MRRRGGARPSAPASARVACAALGLVAIATGACEDDSALGGVDADALATDVDDPLTLEGFGLTVIDIRADPRALDELHRRTAEHEAIEIDASVTIDGRRWEAVALELHGGLARTAPKKSYRLTFPDEDRVAWAFDGEPAPDLQRRLVLQASWIDPTWLRNDLTFAAARELGGLAPRTGFAVVYLGGKRHGLYTVIERVDRPLLRRLGLAPHGNVYKASDHRADWVAKANPLDGYEQKINEDNPTDDLGPLLDTLTHTPLNAGAFHDAVEPLLHLDDWMTYQLVHTYALNQDAFTKNYYLHHDLDAPPDSVRPTWRLISWDADATWGLSWDGAAIPPDAWPGEGAGTSWTPWHGRDGFSPRILAIPFYRADYLARFADALDGPLAPAALDARVARRGAEIADAARDDLARWQPARDFDQELARLREAVATRHRVMAARVATLRGRD